MKKGVEYKQKYINIDFAQQLLKKKELWSLRYLNSKGHMFKSLLNLNRSYYFRDYNKKLKL